MSEQQQIDNVYRELVCKSVAACSADDLRALARGDGEWLLPFEKLATKIVRHANSR